MLSTIPRAATAGRDAFAGSCARRLAARGVVTNQEALRRLDRVDAVVVDSHVLLADRCRVLRADDAASWSTASRLIRKARPDTGFEPGERVAGDDRVELRAGHVEGRRSADDPRGLPLVLESDRGRHRVL